MGYHQIKPGTPEYEALSEGDKILADAGARFADADEYPDEPQTELIFRPRRASDPADKPPATGHDE